MNFKFFIFFPILFGMLFVTNVFADEQLPGSVVAVEGDPFYFSENDFGLKILKYFERPLDPYLVTGVTTEKSSVEEIMDAYNESTKDKSQQIIVPNESRAQIIRVSFFGAEITDKKTFDSFLKFEHLEVQRTYNPTTPYYYDISQEGFVLESLLTEDKKWFYDFIASRTINNEKDPEPFDVDIEVLSGSGDVLQIWEYRECSLAEYFPYLDENLGKIKFVGDFISEIRDVSAFECGGFHVNFEPNSNKMEKEFLTDSQIAQKILVQFSGGELESEKTYFTFSKFVPVKDLNLLPIKVPGFPINEKPQFSLESLPSKDKQEFYDFISRYIDPVKSPEPFDVKIHLVTDNNSILQTWNYEECTGTSYVAFFLNNLFFYKFKQTMGSEIRDKSFFECNGIEIQTNETLDPEILSEIAIPDNFNRAQIFRANFEGPDISPSKTITTFTKFSPLTNDELSILLPGAPFGGKPKFYFESLVSDDKEWFYEVVGMYMNKGKSPEPFDVSTEIVAGDGTILQTWDYEDCHVIDYKSFLEDALVLRKFTKQFYSEIHDRAIFECEGFSLNPTQTEPENTRDIALDYVDFISSPENKAQRFVLNLFGGEIAQTQTYFTFAKFEPLFEEFSDQTSRNNKFHSEGFAIESLPSVDKENYYHLLEKYVNPGKKPEPFDASVELVSDTGTILQTWEYSKCQLSDFDSFLQDNLLYYTMSGKKAVSEIRDRSVFICSGFSVDFAKYENVYLELPDVIPKYEDRAVMYLYHVSGGEFEKTYSTGLVSKFSTKSTLSEDLETLATYSGLRSAITIEDAPDEIKKAVEIETRIPTFMGESLPTKFDSTLSQTIERYVNPGKNPEPFDVRVDAVTGDGTILYSADYDKCSIHSYSIYLNDGIAWIKFTPSLKSEFRDRVEIECVGVNSLVMPQKNSEFAVKDNLSFIKPLVQLKVGVSVDEIICKDGLSLMLRPPTNTAICVFDEHLSKLENRGWIVSETQPQQISTKLMPIIPTNDERAKTILVHFQGPEIDDTKTLTTFSKFSPIESQNYPILVPEHDFEEDAALFYLESLPSSDKDWLYSILSQYINPGKIPEPLDIKIELYSGDENLLQTWDYVDCNNEKYEFYLDDSVLIYKFHEKWQSEYKDRMIFLCEGLSFEENESIFN